MLSDELQRVLNETNSENNKSDIIILDCRPKKTLLPPPLGNFADIVYLKEQSFLHRIRDVCTL